MKKIAIVSSSVALEGEKGLNRIFFLANLVSQNGFDVELITSKFHHWSKSFRNEETRIVNEHLKITFLDEIGYKKNIEPKRIISHYILAQNVEKYLADKDYDLIYCAIPDNKVARKSGEYAKKKGIPFIVDVEDLWPEAMRMVLDVPVLSDILFSYYTIDAKKTYQLANGIVGSSETYMFEPKKYNVEVEKSITVYVGNDVARFDNGVKENYDKVNKPEGEYWVSYAGTLGSSYDIATLIKACKVIEDNGNKNLKLMILGDGPLKEEFEQIAKDQHNVVFLGYTKFELMAAYLAKSDIVVNSIVKKAPQSFVSKIGDYLASNTPMINTCIDPEFWYTVEDKHFGVNVEPENVEAMVNGINYLISIPKECKEMAKVGRQFCEEKFDRSKSYLNIVNLMNDLLQGK